MKRPKIDNLAIDLREPVAQHAGSLLLNTLRVDMNPAFTGNKLSVDQRKIPVKCARHTIRPVIRPC